MPDYERSYAYSSDDQRADFKNVELRKNEDESVKCTYTPYTGERNEGSEYVGDVTLSYKNYEEDATVTYQVYYEQMEYLHDPEIQSVTDEEKEITNLEHSKYDSIYMAGYGWVNSYVYKLQGSAEELVNPSFTFDVDSSLVTYEKAEFTEKDSDFEEEYTEGHNYKYIVTYTSSERTRPEIIYINYQSESVK